MFGDAVLNLSGLGMSKDSQDGTEKWRTSAVIETDKL